jgi:hypothetical protein
MDDTNSKEVAKEVEKELTRLMQPLIQPLVPKGQRRFRFAIGMLCLAPFCITVAFFIWPRAMYLDRMMWLGCAVLVVLLGAWQLDKSNKEAEASGGHDRPTGCGPPNKVISLRKRP